MNAMVRLIDRLTTALAMLGTLGILAMMVHIALDVFLRSTFSLAVPATLELVTRYYMIMLALLPLGWVEWSRNMITVEAFSGIYGALGVRVIDSLVALLSAGIYSVLMVGTWHKAVDEFQSGAYILALDTKIAVWPTYFVLPAAFALAMLVCLAKSPLSLRKTAPAGSA